MQFKIACAGLLSVAFAASAAAGPYDPIWVDLTTGAAPRRIFVNIASITAVADKRTAELMFAEGDSAWPPGKKLEADCSSLTYRLSPTEKWRADDPDNVRRICKKNFGGLRKYYADELGMRPEILKALSPSGTYLHRPSQTYFPRELAGFHRTKLSWSLNNEGRPMANYEQPSKFGASKLIIDIQPLEDWYGPTEVDNPNPDKLRVCSSHRSFMRSAEGNNGRVEAEVEERVQIAGRNYAHFGGTYAVQRYFEGYGVGPGRFRTETYCDFDANRVVEFWFEQPEAADPTALDRIIKEGPFPGRRIK
jgi:hypothetical protein